MLASPSSGAKPLVQSLPDMADLVGQFTARRVLEITVAGGHNLLMMGPPGAGKSMLAARLPGILPEISAAETLEVTMIHSVAGQLHDENLIWQRPHLDSLRQTIETHKAVVSRANHHVTYPARFQLIAAMNPCRCGYLGDPARACSRAPLCSQQYLSKISGPMLDRFDLLIEVPEVPIHMMMDKSDQETSADIRARVMAAQQKAKTSRNQQKLNADLSPDEIDATIKLDDASRALLHQAAEKNALSARGFHRVLRVARTIADLANDEETKDFHLAEALQYRRLATES